MPSEAQRTVALADLWRRWETLLDRADSVGRLGELQALADVTGIQARAATLYTVLAGVPWAAAGIADPDAELLAFETDLGLLESALEAAGRLGLPLAATFEAALDAEREAVQREAVERHAERWRDLGNVLLGLAGGVVTALIVEALL